MNNILYEDGGVLHVGVVAIENESSLQIDALNGKRVKIKRSHAILTFKDDIKDLLQQAEKIAESIDSKALWALCNDDEFDICELADHYFKHPSTTIEYTAILCRLRSEPMYFYKRGSNRFKAAPPVALEAALASVARKAHDLAQINAWSAELLQGKLPLPIAQRLTEILHAPQKQSLEYRAFQAVCLEKSLSPLQLAFELGAINTFTDYLVAGFVSKYFPEGAQKVAAPLAVPLDDLRLSEAVAFSIDDGNTTEIDDAFSVTFLPDSRCRVGIHIAAPTLGIPIGSLLEDSVFKRLSTVYMPDQKITLLPTNVIEIFALKENTVCPTLSLYIDLTSNNEIEGYETRLEKIKVGKNFHRQSLATLFNQGLLAAPYEYGDFPFKKELIQLWALVEKHLKKPDINHAVPVSEYTIDVTDHTITINERERDAPVDQLVSTLMILANSMWADQLVQSNSCALYRAQQSGRVYTSYCAKPHTGLGLNQYAWCTSPLRRAVDFVNQRQLIALIQNAPQPYTKKTLLNLAHCFDNTYHAYISFQNQLERAWALQWLLQEHISHITAYYLEKDSVQLKGLPIRAHVANLPASLSRGDAIKLAITTIDTLNQSIVLEFLSLDCSILLLTVEW